eukprot:gene21091-15590_t
MTDERALYVFDGWWDSGVVSDLGDDVSLWPTASSVAPSPAPLFPSSFYPPPPLPPSSSAVPSSSTATTAAAVTAAQRPLTGKLRPEHRGRLPSQQPPPQPQPQPQRAPRSSATAVNDRSS